MEVFHLPLQVVNIVVFSKQYDYHSENYIPHFAGNVLRRPIRIFQYDLIWLKWTSLTFKIDNEKTNNTPGT